ncbi:hypothetical protein CRUP_028719 [Coryphaenoides rupestris]|nr:hypothetical protein CRUP_028719 [Coryphaenoides rupestris]
MQGETILGSRPAALPRQPRRHFRGPHVPRVPCGSSPGALMSLGSPVVPLQGPSCPSGPLYFLSRGPYVSCVSSPGALSPCPVEMTPARLVMRYGDQASVNCGNSTEDASRNLLGISWRVGQQTIPGPHWDVARDIDWDPRPACVANFSGMGECSKAFDLTFYKTPDIVRISAPQVGVGMLADSKYQLVCEVLNVAPVQNLMVRWFLGQTPIQDQGTVKVHGCSPARGNCSGTRSPVNVTSHLQVVLRRDQSRAQFRCEAQLTLKTLDLPPTVSHPLNITVLYVPVINRTRLPAIVPVFRGYPEDLVCIADGRPSPTVFWLSEGGVRVFGGTLTVTEAGSYICNASNVAGFTLREVEVVLKEDYLPLIAGLVAVIVVVTAGLFLFFYSIYYKNSKMRHYSLRRHKRSAHNGNVAHSSWVAPLPMIKRS